MLKVFLNYIVLAEVFSWDKSKGVWIFEVSSIIQILLIHETSLYSRISNNGARPPPFPLKFAQNYRSCVEFWASASRAPQHNFQWKSGFIGIPYYRKLSSPCVPDIVWSSLHGTTPVDGPCGQFYFILFSPNYAVWSFMARFYHVPQVPKYILVSTCDSHKKDALKPRCPTHTWYFVCLLLS